MHGIIAPTDFDWYEFLRARETLDEVNFWQPSGAKTFHSKPPGTPFFFKLKAPHNAIGGFGFLARASVLPAWLAWESFEEANGATTFEEMVARIERYRKPEKRDPSGSYSVGCLMITQPVFFAPGEWVREPSDWGKATVQGRQEDLSQGEGLRIYQECQARVQADYARAAGGASSPSIAEPAERFGQPTLVRPRLGQGTFRIAVTDAYGRTCAVSSEHSLPALEAAHIRPYAKGGEHATANGLLLRSDFHRLFDKGYVTVTPEHRFEVSARLKADFENGRTYYPLHGKQINVPHTESDRPDAATLTWHNENCFLG